MDRIDDALLAAQAGATRIEMNYSLDSSGLTPSPASCRWLAERCPVPVFAMLRPHDQGFRYSHAERWCLFQDCEALLATGVAGIVFGALDETGQVDQQLTERMVRLCQATPLVFHRAIDEVENQLDALEQLVDCGVKRVLTSGGAATAEAGADRLRELQQRARGRIEVLPGSGVGPHNAEKILLRVGGTQLHGSFRCPETRRPGEAAIRETRSVMERVVVHNTP